MPSLALHSVTGCLIFFVEFKEMEAEHQRRSGFMKSLYKAAKPGSQQARYSSKAKSNPTATNGSVGVKMQQNFSTIDQTLSSAKPNGFVDSAEAEVHVHSHGDYGGDENVDSKASTYISYVRDRFK